MATPSSEAGPSLASFLEATPSARHLRVETDFGNGFYRLRIDEAERRQAIQDIRSSEDVLVEMLRNARDAGARHVFSAVSREGKVRRICIVDDGEGIPPAMHELVFESRVTSKLDTMRMDSWGVHGRGMALYSIAQNAIEARVAASDAGLGAAIAVATDTDRLGERRDQSAFPVFALSDEGTVRIRGPRNILRTACEFALESRKALSVYLGSPAEVAATLYAFGCATVPASSRAFADTGRLPLAKRLACAADERAFAQMSSSIGLDLSERTARRILDGELSALPSLLERIEREGFAAHASASKRARPVRGSRRAERRAKLDPDDLAAFASQVSRAFQEIAEAYYLDADVEAQARVEGDRLVVSLPLRAAD